MTDLRSPHVLWLKAVLFVVLGMLAVALLLAEHPTPKVALLVGLAVWAFARAYYFAFHVLEHYVDGEFKFAGLGSVIRHLLRRRTRP